MRFNKSPQILPDLESWKCITNGYSFVISLEHRQIDKKYTGYTASWKNLKFDISAFGSQPSNFIDGGPWKTFKEAEEACYKTLRQLKAKN